MTKLGKGELIILKTPLNANLENLWALVTKTIGHPLHQVKQINCSIQGPGEKTTWEKAPPLSKPVESGFRFEKIENVLLQSSSL